MDRRFPSSIRHGSTMMVIGLFQIGLILFLIWQQLRLMSTVSLFSSVTTLGIRNRTIPPPPPHVVSESPQRNAANLTSWLNSTPTTDSMKAINWTRRVLDKREWLQNLQTSLPYLLWNRKSYRKPSMTCKVIKRFMQDAWQVHSLAYTNDTTIQEHRHAILIPYRDRPYHLPRFLVYLSHYLQHHYQEQALFKQQDEQQPQKHSFAIYIVEQADHQLFNRALLTNVGLDHVSPETECITQHDVDLVPAFYSAVPYHKCTMPMHMARRAQSKDFKLPFIRFSGAVMTMHQQHWALVNGMDNQYQGWGCEDDDLYIRLAYTGLANCSNSFHGAPFRPSPQDSVFTTISQDVTHHTRGILTRGALHWNQRRRKDYQTTGLNPAGHATGGWKQSTYHIVSRETWTNTSVLYPGIAEIHHIRVKVNISALEKCFVYCKSNSTRT